MPWTVRAPHADDADAVAQINVAGWRHAYRGMMPDAVLDGMQAQPRADRLRQRWAGDHSADGHVVTDDDDTVRGYCWFGDFRPGEGQDGCDWGEVYALYVDPAAIGTGAGAALMTAALRDLGPRPVALWVLERNTVARAFYERFGFAADGAVEDFDAGGTLVPEVRYVRPA